MNSEVRAADIRRQIERDVANRGYYGGGAAVEIDEETFDVDLDVVVGQAIDHAMFRIEHLLTEIEGLQAEVAHCGCVLCCRTTPSDKRAPIHKICQTQRGQT